MRNYNEQIEAAYMFSKRQGNLMRDRERERSSHEDRRNRYISEEPQPGVRRYDSPFEWEGNHRGKGPRNYKRSDERIKEMISDLLSDHPDLDASDVEVEVKESEVFLTGTVPEKRAKRLAEDIVDSVTGVTHVENRIRVKEQSMA